jgi:amidase
MQLADLDATAQAELVRRGQASPRELVEAAIARIERSNHELGAVNIPLYEQARKTADDPQLPDGPFRGVPILIKDICATVEGVLQTSGLLPLRRANYRAPVDSYLVRTLRRAGFVIVGKTNCSELGILPAAEPPAWPPTRNPYDPARGSGGSSGGAACAAATGMVPIAHANDGGGSIRIPASCCGLFGLKPSRGRISLGPLLGQANGGLVNEHVVTRSVRDSAAVLDVLAGLAPGDPYTAPPPLRPYVSELNAPPGKLRIAYATRHPTMDGAVVESHPDCLAAVDHAARLLTSLGHHIERRELDVLDDNELLGRFLAIWFVGVTNGLDDAAAVLGRPIEQNEVEPLTWALGELGRLITGPGYEEAWRAMHLAARRIAALYDDYDLWLTPTLAEPPVPLGTFASTPDDPLAGIMRAGDFAPFTPLFNATGQPACSIPIYRNAAGLPIGVQLVAAYGREDLLLRVASQLETAQPFVHAATRH